MLLYPGVMHPCDLPLVFFRLVSPSRPGLLSPPALVSRSIYTCMSLQEEVLCDFLAAFSCRIYFHCAPAVSGTAAHFKRTRAIGTRVLIPIVLRYAHIG